MPRKPINNAPMTPAERVRKHREQKQAANPLDKKKLLRDNNRLKKQNEALGQKCERLKREVEMYVTFLGNSENLLDLSILETKSPFNGEIIKLLKQLCHPDKHNQSQASIRASAFLNSHSKK